MLFKVKVREMPDSQVRALRPHTKSKGGCRMCKVRKVKCSETRPSCASCLRRNESCEYESDNIRFRHVDMESSSSAISESTPLGYPPPSPNPPYNAVEDFNYRISIESTERRLLELRLMHHFTSSTIHSGFFSSEDEDVFQLWGNDAPSLSFHHPYLLNVILSIAALHITKLQPEQAEMADIHRIYFNAAISQLRQAVHDITPENAEAICLTNIVIGLPSFILLQNTEPRNYSPPVELFSILAANVPLFRTAIPQIPISSRVLLVTTTELDFGDFGSETYKGIYPQQFLALSSWRAAGEIVDEESLEAYEFSLSYVVRLLAAIESNAHQIDLRRLLYAFPSFARPMFVQRLRERNPRALVILAYYFSLAKAMDNVWWMRGIAEREVFGIQSILPEEWQWAMTWPLQKIAYFAASQLP